ncbi:phage tail protein [Salmonella enterica]|nr:phage tail protein [Salmonella enterica]ECC9376328.1 phage tail protein [Salmonella enterica subsp. enterica]ECI4859987.1 phage tail protein [Salmonella enterica subsp. enterica]ECM6994114.1 phage tail protein [Salmonella enterica subsp. enterica serovar Typhimurium]EDK6791267.1 phage tail protein [Salmonella enterica]
MGADKTNNIMTLSSGVSQPLLADVQYFELYSSSALNRKLKNIVLPGFYCGFEPVPGTGLSVRITSENSEGKGAASVDVNNVQISVQQIEDVTVSVKAGATNIIVLEANFEHGVKTTQVDSASSVSAARIFARTDNAIGQNQIELCRVIVPGGATAVTKEMIVLKYRVNRAVGVEFSNEISSTEERKAATPLAVKTLHDLVDTKAPLDSPHLSGTPTSPTPEPGTNNTQIANAAFVYAAINALINGAPGTMDTLKEIAAAINNDPKFSETINNALALKAPLASPAFTGTPTAPTASQGANSTQIANTAFVKAAITTLINGAPSTLDTLKEIAAAINNDPNFSTTINNALALKAPLASPALTGVPTAPTAAQGTNNTQIATTAYVRAAISALVGSSPEALDTLNELAAALDNDPNFATTMTNALAGKQPLDATLTALAGLPTGANKLPYFTGTDTVAQADLTQVGRDILAKSSTQAIIQYLGLGEGSALPVGVPVPWPSATPPTGWLKCNGAAFSSEKYPNLAKVYPTNKLPDLRGEFIRGWDDGRGIDTGRTLLSGQDGTSFSHYGGNFDIGSGHAISNYDQIIANQPGFTRFSFAGPSRGDGVNFVTIRPRNIAFNYIVRAA